MDKKDFCGELLAGVACVVMTVIFRGLAAQGIWPILVPANGAGITYITFRRAAESFCCCPSPRRWHSKTS